MLIIRKNQTNNLFTTVSMNKTLPNPYYLFSFQHIASKERVSFIPEVLVSNNRYDKFRFEETGFNNLTVTPPKVNFNYIGQYYYAIYEQISPTNTDIALAYNKLEAGRAVVIVGEDQEQECFYEPYISSNETFENVIYISEQEQFCISGDTTPECVESMTGVCPTFLTRYSPTNSIYYKNTGLTANFLSTFDSCAPVQIAMDDSRLFMVDGCSNYYQYDYTITSGGCFNLTLVNQWDVWESSGQTPNAAYSIAVYDANNLIIGETARFVGQTGSTFYLYNLTTSGLTKWLEIGNNASVNNIYYNTGNTQFITSWVPASGGTGYYQLYSGSTNPQLISQIANPYSNAGSTIYFSGNTPIAVNVAGLQFALDFSASTVTLLETSGGIPIYYVDFEDGFGYLSTIAQKASCYNFDIQVIPPTPSVTPTNTVTPTVTPTLTPTITPTITLTPTMTQTPSGTPPPNTPLALGALWWVDFTDASTLTISGGLVQTALDKVNNIPFTAASGGPLYNPTGYLGVSGSVRSNATQLTNPSGSYSGITEWTWFGRVYDDAVSQRGGKIMWISDILAYPSGGTYGYVADFNFNPYPPGPVWTFLAETNGGSATLDANFTYSAWTNIALRFYSSGGKSRFELWENGTELQHIEVPSTTPGLINDAIFNLMWDGGEDFNTEQFFFKKKLTNGEMNQMFSYLTNKY